MKTQTTILTCLVASFAICRATGNGSELNYESIHCPPAGQPSQIPSPSYPNMTPEFSVCSEEVINAPIKKVYDAIIGFKQYPMWNTFCFNVTAVNGTLDHVKLYDDLAFSSTGVLPGGQNGTDREIVTVLRRGQRTAMTSWKYDYESSGQNMFKAEHTYYLLNQAEAHANHTAQTRVISSENFFGKFKEVTTDAIRHNLQQQFDVQNGDLKKFVEGKTSKGESSSSDF